MNKIELTANNKDKNSYLNNIFSGRHDWLCTETEKMYEICFNRNQNLMMNDLYSDWQGTNYRIRETRFIFQCFDL